MRQWISLAKAAGLGLSTIVDFDRSRRRVPEPTVDAIHHALEKAGVEFIAEDDGGPGVRLRKAKMTPSGLGHSKRA
jgi:hypothetical protein